MAAVSASVTSPVMTQSLLGRLERFGYQLKSKSGLLPPEDMEFGLRKATDKLKKRQRWYFTFYAFTIPRAFVDFESISADFSRESSLKCDINVMLYF